MKKVKEQRTQPREDKQGNQGKQKENLSPQSSSSPKSHPLPTPHSPLPIPEGWLEIGTIVAAQGIDGELRVYPDTDFPERFEVPGMRWLLCPDSSQPKQVELLSGRYVDGKNLCIVSLAGVKSRNQAEELRGCKLLVLESDRPELGEGEYHIVDLVGLEVFVQESGELVGTVVNLISVGHDLLEVKLKPSEEEQVISNKKKTKGKKQKNLLIPFVKEIVPVVDLENRRVEITPPPRLLEINS
jgi:16S rRNA processing protein RimM